jgi:hypothetical protein
MASKLYCLLFLFVFPKALLCQLFMKDKQKCIISYKMYVFQPCFKMNNIIFSMFFFFLGYQMKIFLFLWVLIYIVTCLLPCGETNLFFFSPWFHFLHNFISEVGNENNLTMDICQNLICLKLWNFHIGNTSQVHSWNPSSFPFCHFRFILLTLLVCIVVSLSLLAYC